jgi:hypothetical protein
LEILANPTANGGYDAHFARADQIYDIFQEKPGDPIRVRFFKVLTSRHTASTIDTTPKFQLAYYPNGEVGYAVEFDRDGRPTAETKIKEENLRRAALSAHDQTLDFLRKHQKRLGEGLLAFQRMEAPLKQLRPSTLDLGKRAAWYSNFAVIDGKTYSLRTQNFGFGALQENPSLNSIAIFEDQGSRNVELFRISQTGEINYPGEGSPRRPPDPKQFALIHRLSHELELAQTDPRAYQTRLHEGLAKLERSSSAKLERPEIGHTALQWSPNPTARGALGEPMETITKGRDLWRIIRPFVPQEWRWENPENPSEVHYLRPKGKMRWVMSKELMRWVWKGMWHSTINHVTNHKPQAGELKLHILPDGSTELEIYRNFTSVVSDGTEHEERGIYNILRRNADGSSIDLDNIVRQIAKEQPDILKYPRAVQLKLASQTLTGFSDLPRSLDMQLIPEIPIHQLRVGNRGPLSATEAWEAMKYLPELMGLKAQWSSESESLLNPKETRYHLNFPGSQPPTEITIREESHTTGSRVVVNFWQGDSAAVAVYDNGVFNDPESGRLNKADNQRSRLGTRQVPWYKYIGPGAAQMRTYFEIHAPAFFLGYLAYFPSAWLGERLFWTQEQRDRMGTTFSYSSLKHGLGAAVAMAAPATTAALTVDGVFNYVGGLSNSLVDKFKKDVTWGEAYRYNSPRLMNPPPARFRPIPKPAFSFNNIGQSGSAWVSAGRSLKWSAPYLRSLLQRGVPLFVGLFAVEGYHSLGKNWKFWNVVSGNLPPGAKINWKNIERNFYHVGAVSLGSAMLVGMAARSTELAVARRAAGQSIRGLGGFLLRNKLLAEAPKGMAGARFALTWRASLLTIAAETAVLGIWDAIERKQSLLHEERNLRADLSRSMDRYNRILTRLQFGEEIPSHKLQEAQSDILAYYQQYRSYLKLMGRDQGEAKYTSVELENDFRATYLEMETDRWAAQGALSDGVVALTQWEHQNKLQRMRLGDEQTEQRLRDLYRTHGMPIEEPIQQPGKPPPSPETVARLIEEERKIIADATKDNRHVARLAADLASNGTALEKQMEDYLKRTSVL